MEKIICNNCNKEISTDSGASLAFCTNCGAPLKNIGETPTLLDNNYSTPALPVRKNSSLKYVLGFLGGGLVLILLSVIGFLSYWWISSQKPAENNVTATENTNTAAENTNIVGKESDYFGKIIVPDTQTLRYIGGATTGTESLDPQLEMDNDIIQALFDGLAEYKNQDSDLTPSLATKWEKDAEAKVWTFYLRRDAKWSDGKPITAKDFVYSWRRALNPSLYNQQAYLLYHILNAEEYNSEKAIAEDVGVKDIDDHTLQVTLKSPIPYFDKMIAQHVFRPVPQHIIEKYGKDWAKPENIVTSGAFKLVEWKEDKQIVVERNSSFWDNDNTKLEKIVFLLNDKNSDNFLPSVDLYKDGEIDITVRPALKDENVEEKKDYIRYKRDGIEYYDLNTRMKPLDDVRVRQALNLAIDRDKSDVKSSPAKSFVPEMKGYDSPKVIKFDPDKARTLLADAGFPGGKGFPELEIAYNTAESNKKNAEFVRDQWQKELGITIKLQNYDWKKFLVMRKNLEYKGVARAGWVSEFSDPIAFLDFMSYPDNSTGWTDNKFTEMLEKTYTENDQEKRYQMLSDAETYMLEQYPVVPIYMVKPWFLSKPYVKNFNINPTGRTNWREVYIDTDLKLES